MCKANQVKSLFLFFVLTLGVCAEAAQAEGTYIQPYGFATVSQIKDYQYKSSETNQVTLVGKLTAQRVTNYDNKNSRNFVFKDNTGEINVTLKDGYDWSDLGGGELVRLSGYFVRSSYSYSENYFMATQGAPMNAVVIKSK